MGRFQYRKVTDAQPGSCRAMNFLPPRSINFLPVVSDQLPLRFRSLHVFPQGQAGGTLELFEVSL